MSTRPRFPRVCRVRRVRRLAPVVLALGLIGSACSLTPRSDIDAGAPVLSSTGSTATVGSVPESPAFPADDATAPSVAGASTTTDTVIDSTLPTVDEQPPSTGPADDPIAPGTEDDQPTVSPETDTGTGPPPATEPEPGDEPGNDPNPNETPGPVTLPSKALDNVLVATGDFSAEAHSLDDPVNLVLLGRGTHVADLLVEVGQVPAGSTLVVDYGDGSVANVGVVSTGQHVEVTHAYEPTLTFDNQNVVATVTQADGTEHRDRLTFGTRARFALFYSPITVEALNDCDTFGKGDFRLTWDHGEGEREATFKLGAGESARIGGFAHAGGAIVYDQVVPFELELAEEDPWGAALFAPWKWDSDFEGAPVPYVFQPVRQIGDHTVTVNRTSSTDEGVEGDDDCATSMSFDITLDMLDD